MAPDPLFNARSIIIEKQKRIINSWLKFCASIFSTPQSTQRALDINSAYKYDRIALNPDQFPSLLPQKQNENLDDAHTNKQNLLKRKLPMENDESNLQPYPHVFKKRRFN